MRFFFSLVFIIIVVALVGGGAYWAWDGYRQSAPLKQDTTVTIPRGAGVSLIAQKLSKANVIESPRLFRVMARLKKVDQSLPAGEFAFHKGITMDKVFDTLVNGKAISYKITFPEGLTSLEMVEVLQAEERLTGEITKIPEEGSLLPETYAFQRGDKRQEILQRMQLAMAKTVNELWQTRAPELPFDTLHEAITLASIVERETGQGSERARVASVYVNRLNQDMRLQADPTVIYGLANGRGKLGRPISKTDLKTDHDWNTYTRKGLPKGPIANPGKAAIFATLNPEVTEYIFFVADGTGGHTFSKTLDEHNAAVRKWREIEKQNNGGIE